MCSLIFHFSVKWTLKTGFAILKSYQTILIFRVSTGHTIHIKVLQLNIENIVPAPTSPVLMHGEVQGYFQPPIWGHFGRQLWKNCKKSFSVESSEEHLNFIVLDIFAKNPKIHEAILKFEASTPPLIKFRLPFRECIFCCG